MVSGTTTRLRSSASEASTLSSLPPLERLALLLDLDGTLIDIAPTPEDVVVPDALPGLLARLGRRVGGALAVVSGRTIASVLALFPAADFLVAGEHGAQLRTPDGALETLALPPVPAGWREELARIAAHHGGVLLEEKPHGFVLHYRRAPAARGLLERAARALLAAHGEDFVLQPAHMAWEIRPRGVDKGGAVQALLRRPAFAGRVPVFVGDDVTDLDGMRAARAAGGFGFEVERTFGDAGGVRAWLGELLDRAGAERGA